MKKIIFIILLIAIGSFNLFAQSEIINEEYDVYSKVLDTDAVLDRFTLANDTDKSLQMTLNKLPKDLVEDFLRKNERSARIEDRLKDFKFSDQDDPTWNVYNPVKNEIHFVYQKRQSVSRIGFSRDGKYALMLHSTGIDGLPYGSAFLVWLEKKTDNWKEKKSFMISEY